MFHLSQASEGQAVQTFHELVYSKAPIVWTISCCKMNPPKIPNNTHPKYVSEFVCVNLSFKNHFDM